MGWKMAFATVEGPQADVETVRRALLLPRKPDLELTFDELTTSEYDDNTLGVFPRDGRVFVLGWSTLGLDPTWAALSRGGGRVLVASLAENFPGNSCAIFQDGVRVRRLQETVQGGDWTTEGPPAAVEPPLDPDEHPFEVLSAILRNVFGEDPIEYFFAETDDGPLIPAWRVRP